MTIFVRRCSALCSSNSGWGLLIQTQPNMRYCSGFTGEGALLIADDIRLLLTDFRYTEQAQQQAPDFQVYEYTRGGYFVLLKRLCEQCALDRLAYEERNVSVAEFDAIHAALPGIREFLPVSQRLEDLRCIKSEDELAHMRSAGALTDLAFSHILPFIKPGACEIDIALELEFFLRKNGADGVSFPPIVASGENGSRPHALPSQRKFRCGDMITMDFGCVVNGYCSDMTRTVALGTLAQEAKNIYTVCLEAQERAACEIAVGLTGQQADSVARNWISRHGFRACFGHGLGHGVGLDIHEAPTLSPSSDTVLKAGMVVSVEPGIYVRSQYGVRIEDFGVIGNTGFEAFVHSPKEFITL